jgi:hypothetical protein
MSPCFGMMRLPPMSEVALLSLPHPGHGTMGCSAVGLDGMCGAQGLKSGMSGLRRCLSMSRNTSDNRARFIDLVFIADVKAGDHVEVVVVEVGLMRQREQAQVLRVAVDYE